MSRRRAEVPAVTFFGTSVFGVVVMVVGFALEVSMLAAFCFWGFRLAMPWNVVLGIGAPLAVAVFWGAFMAPKSAQRLPWPALPLVELLVFLLASMALLSVHQLGLALPFALLAVVYTGANFYLQRNPARPAR